jgi:hypothetical protein
MVKRTEHASAVHVATRAEIERMAADYSGQRQTIIAELQEIFATRAPGTAPPELSDDQVAVRQTARDMLNGLSPASLLPRSRSRENDLYIRRDAIDLVLSVLSTEEARARAIEAAELALECDSEWRQIVHDLMLAYLKVEALEKKAVEFRRRFAGAEPTNMPMLRFIGAERRPSAVGISWATAPLSRPLQEALDAGIVTRRELENAQNV